MTRTFKIYGRPGHRQRESFRSSSTFTVERDGQIATIEVLNADITGSNEYTILRITAATAELCQVELDGQLSDGIFENSRIGRIEEVDEIR